MPKLTFTKNIHDLQTANCYIIAVPTPIDENKVPDLKLLTLGAKL